MSLLGTGIAAGVAQSAQQAERLGRRSDTTEGQRSHATRSQRHLFQSQLHRAGRTPLADQETPDHPPMGYENLYEDAESEADLWQSPSDEEVETEDPAAAIDPDQLHLYTPHGQQPPPLIHHLDLEA